MRMVVRRELRTHRRIVVVILIIIIIIIIIVVYEALFPSLSNFHFPTSKDECSFV